MTKLILIRAALTAAEWKRIRLLAVKHDTPTSHLVAQGLRESLLKGAKP